MPPVRLFLLANLLYAATSIASQLDPPPAHPSPPLPQSVAHVLPDDAQLEADGARIGKIEINTLQIFDLSNPADDHRLFGIADQLHIATRESVIRAQLLFRSGQPYSRKLLDESARNIRQNCAFVREPLIRPLRYRDGIVDIEVITHDVWTLQPGVNFSRSGGANALGFKFSDANFLGTGKSVQIGHSQNVDRSSTYLGWNDPNLAGSRWSDGLMYARNSDGTVWNAGVSYPFYSLETPVAGGADGGDNHSVLQRYRLGEVYDAYGIDWRTADLYLGQALSVTDRWTDRLLVGWRVDRSQFAAADHSLLLAPLPADRNLSYPFARLQWVRNNYVIMRNLDLIARTEDVHEGLDAGVGLGWATPTFGSDRHALIADAELSDAFQFGQSQQLFVNGHLSSRLEHGAWADAIGGGGTSYFLATSASSRLLLSLSADSGHHLDGDHFFDLGGDNGLRGYPLRYQNGDQRALFTIEERLYTHWYPFRLFNVGGAAFYDMGRTWGSTLVPSPQLGLLRDLGVGLRLGNARSSFGSVIHVDLAVPLDRAASISRLQFLVTTQQSY